jgi:hypothetical protein
MKLPGRILAMLLLAIGPALLPFAVDAADGNPGEDGTPPSESARAGDNRASNGAADLRSMMPSFLRNLLGGEPAATAPAQGNPVAAETTDRRPSLVPLVEPLWIDLTPAQQQALAPFAPEWNTWTAAEKKSWVALANRLTKMSDAQRTTAERRILEWANLTPAQRRLARENYRLAKERPADQRVTEWRNYQTLTEEQQAVLRKAGTTSNTAAGHAGAATGLAKEASQPLPRVEPPSGYGYGIYPARGTPR